MKFIPLVIVASFLLHFSLPCTGYTLFGIDLGDFSAVEEFFKISSPSSAVAPVALSAGSGDDVCVAGDQICEASAFIPKSANEAGKPRYISFAIMD